MNINWNPQNVKQLENLYNIGRSDQQIAEYFGSNAVAIGKARSMHGIVRHKVARPKGIVPINPKQVISVDGLICAYADKEGLTHFIQTKTGDEQAAKRIAQNVMIQQGIKEITLFKPHKKLILNHVVEVDM